MMNLSQVPASAILLYCIAAAAILIYLPFLAVSYARARVGLDLAAPRAMFDKLPPYAQRATWAHQNSFETFMVFAAAALMAYVVGQSSQLAVTCAITFVVARLFYSVFYILNVPIARSMMFAIGGICSGILMILSILQVTSSTLP